MFPFGREVDGAASVLADCAYADFDPSYVGASSEPYTFDIDANMVERVAWGVCDARPWNLDVDGATGNRQGGLVAPYALLWTLVNNTPTYRRYERWVMRDLPAGQAHLHTGDEYHFRSPIRPGDRLTATCRIDAIFEKPSRFGRLVFMECVWTFSDDAGREVARLTSKAATLHRESDLAAPDPAPAPAEVLAALDDGTRGAGPHDMSVGTRFVHEWGPVTMKENIRWMAAVDDYATTHYDSSYAQAHGFPDKAPLLAGPHGGGLILAAMSSWLGDGGWIDEFEHIQRAGLVVGETLTVVAIVREQGGPGGCVLLDAWLLDGDRGIRHSGSLRVTPASRSS
jgi:acyl dehydratase